MKNHEIPSYVYEGVARRISGDLVWSNMPGAAMRKWREIYGLSQSELAKLMNISYSVISDYERGKRVPGRRFIKAFVKSLLNHDAEKGWATTKRVAYLLHIYVPGVIDIAEFYREITLDEALLALNGILLSPTTEHRPIKGYTILDSVKTVESIAANEFVRLMGATSDRIMVFTRISRGRSPMVAIRVAPVKPSIVVLHGIKKVDPLAIRIARIEEIPLIVSEKPVDAIIEAFHKYTIP